MITSRFRPLLLALALIGCPETETKQTSGEGGGVPPTPPATPASQPAAEQPAEAPPPGKPIAGTVKLGEGLSAADVKPSDVLFLMVRESQGGGKYGRLIAVQRHAEIQFPKTYEIGANDVMVPGNSFQGPFIVMARLDRDGDPMTRKPDDLYATLTTEVSAGARDVDLTLGKSTPQDVPAENAAPPQQPASRPHP